MCVRERMHCAHTKLDMLLCWTALTSGYSGADDYVCVCVQWAERLLEEGGSEQWGENWEETFAHGKGGKKVLFCTFSLACCFRFACATLLLS